MSVRPRVFAIGTIASAHECDAIRRLAESRVTSSVTYIAGQAVKQNSARTSSSGWLNLPADGATGDEAALRAVWQRLASIVRLDTRTSESMQAISYRVGEHYHYHMDTGGAPNIAGRAVTALLYLSDGFTGGETSFALSNDQSGNGTRNNVYRVREEFDGCSTDRGIAVTPKAGTAVVFYNLHPNSASKDWSAWHASCDVRSGVKWAANLWFHLSLAEQLYLQSGEPPQRWPQQSLDEALVASAHTRSGAAAVTA